MQKIGFVLSCLVMLNWACGGKSNEKVVAEVTTQKTEVAAASEQVKSIQQALESKIKSLGDSVYAIPDTSMLGRTINGRNKLDGILQNGEKIKQDLEQLAADHAAGKVKGEEYEAKFKALQEASKKYSESAKYLSDNIRKMIQ